ncbi:MAG: metallophosphoesterase family protein [Candidatus Hydrogenedens sp.]|jgi:3',5'-cyclic AMP phosphodiesterase CpdA|nr:metallophosphoesterase family protein [Candidatus Hydrogenedens sp.]
MKKIVLLTLILSVGLVATADDAQKIPLKFREDGTFKIVQFADLHWTYGYTEDKLTGKLMRTVLDAEKPDLVVFTGDNITGGTLLPTRSLRQVTLPCVERKIPWAAVFGNHDDEGNASRERLMEIMINLPYSLCLAGPEDIDGVGNYSVVIGASQDPEKPAANLFMIDSLDYMMWEGQSRYGHIMPSQIEWFKEESARRREAAGGVVLPSLAFFHIPLPEFRQAWDSGNAIGVKQEEICDSPVNSGLFDVMKETGDVLGIFCGHDHTNDYVGEVDGIFLGYGRGSGHGTYGKEGFPRGGRVIELIEGERRFRTWHRLDTGDQVMQIP